MLRLAPELAVLGLRNSGYSEWKSRLAVLYWSSPRDPKKHVEHSGMLAGGNQFSMSSDVTGLLVRPDGAFPNTGTVSSPVRDVHTRFMQRKYGNT